MLAGGSLTLLYVHSPEEEGEECSTGERGECMGWREGEGAISRIKGRRVKRLPLVLNMRVK